MFVKSLCDLALHTCSLAVEPMLCASGAGCAPRPSSRARGLADRFVSVIEDTDRVSRAAGWLTPLALLCCCCCCCCWLDLATEPKLVEVEPADDEAGDERTDEELWLDVGAFVGWRLAAAASG